MWVIFDRYFPETHKRSKIIFHNKTGGHSNNRSYTRELSKQCSILLFFKDKLRTSQSLDDRKRYYQLCRSAIQLYKNVLVDLMLFPSERAECIHRGDRALHIQRRRRWLHQDTIDHLCDCSRPHLNNAILSINKLPPVWWKPFEQSYIYCTSVYKYKFYL